MRSRLFARSSWLVHQNSQEVSLVLALIIPTEICFPEVEQDRSTVPVVAVVSEDDTLGNCFKDTTQLAYWDNLLRMNLTPSSAAAGFINKFAADSLKSTEAIFKVLPLAPCLDEKYYRKLPSCVIDEFKASTLLNIDLLQGLVQLVENASPECLGRFLSSF
ncbi:hypothetical protein K457DRAFT_1877050 [Linnemannia elongata AG-77]|uniref:Uncharacterized protein n=1 Tax=Linnemannia elongata AG-77 TaxID=1314771 RepID=A0A197JSP5_9FUNG|nr:hypothetical protein K457DRAFT_1877050 [Linnemannia elongata AG-77]